MGFGFVAAGAAMLLAAPLLFDVAWKGKFPGGQDVLGWTLVFCIWCGLALVAQNYLLCAEKAGLVCVAVAVGLAGTVALNLVLLPRYGLVGAVLSATAANGLVLWLTCRFNRRLGFRLDAGVRMVFMLPILLCLGPWVTILAMLAIAVAAIWGNHLLTPDEKQQLGEGIVAYWKRAGLFFSVDFIAPVWFHGSLNLGPGIPSLACVSLRTRRPAKVGQKRTRVSVTTTKPIRQAIGMAVQ